MLKDDLSEDIPGSRSTIEDVATRFNITFLFVMSMIGAGTFMVGMYQSGAHVLKNVSEPLVLIGVGMVGFSLFFPWFMAISFARHYLHIARDLEGRLDRLEKAGKPPKVDSPWGADDDII